MAAAATRSKSEQPTCAAMSALVARRGPRTIERDPALSTAEGSLRSTCRSESPPAISAAAIDITAVKRTSRQSKRTSNATGSEPNGMALASIGAAARAMISAANAASIASSSASTNSWRASRARPAPIATRMPNSVCRAANRATSRPPALAQATSSSTATSAMPSASGRVNRSRASDSPRLASPSVSRSSPARAICGPSA